MRRIAPILGFLLLLIPGDLWAQVPNPCPIPGLPCFTGGAEEVASFAMTTVFGAMRMAFVGLLVIFFFMYAMRLLMEGEEEGTVTDVKNAYGQAIVGAAIASLSTFLVDAFGRDAGDTIVNYSPLETGLGQVILYLRAMVGIAVMAMIIFQGVRLILLQGQESEMEAQRKRFFHSLVGVVIVLVAEPIVTAINPELGANPSGAAVQIIGIINFLLTVASGLAVIAMIAAGLFLIFSTEDGGKDKAKKIIFTTAVALIVMMCSYLIVRFFMA